MRIRDHNKGDLALAALTLGVTAAAAVNGAVRWAGRHRRAGGRAPDTQPVTRQPHR